ncbi:zinc-binding dehydrogenase [Planctomycetota bacterium]
MASKYKAAVWTDINKVQIEERPIPLPGAGKVLLEIKAAGICGTDLHILGGKHPEAKPPLVIGHEFSGRIVEVGKGVDKKLIGDRVGCDSYIGCNECKYCLSGQPQLCEKGTCELGVNIDGGWAEYVVAPVENLYTLPETVNFLEAGAGCILNCPMAAIEAVKIEAGDIVLILGDGPSSLIMVQLAILKGASKVIVSGHRKRRLDLAIELGADKVINTHTEDMNEAIASLASAPNVVIDAVGKSETFASALSLAAKRGRIHIFGLPEGPVNNIPLDQFLWKELTLKSSTGAPALWPVAMNLMSKGLLKVEPLITHRFALDKASEALEYIRNNSKEIIKAVFDMDK